MFKKCKFISAVLCSSLCSILLLGSSGVQAADEPENYTLTRQYGSVMFKVFYQEYVNMIGRFDNYAGSLYLDSADMSNSRLTASVNMASLSMADDDVVETLVSSSSWFNTNLYTEASFETLSVVVTGEDTADFVGELSFVGITRPWTLHAQFYGGSDGELSGSTVGMQATGSFDRTEFGLDGYLNLAVKDVNIEINVKFNRD